jgi:hypothetical protein
MKKIRGAKPSGDIIYTCMVILLGNPWVPTFISS